MESEALKLALEALESSDKLINGSGHQGGLEGAMDGYYCGCFDVDGNNKLLNKAITAIKEALAQPAQREWNAALDEAAARIGEITAFSKATQDSFAVYIKGLKR